ncbi:MAG: rhomboid family intramembrane serine protease [Oceanipulchritudo sp.]
MPNMSFREANPVVPPVIMNLLIANGMLFFLQTFFRSGTDGLLERYFALWPLGIDAWAQNQGFLAGADVSFYPWQILSYGFLHGNLAHIFFNMLALWMFGREIEIRWGSRRFGIYYFTCLAGAGIIQLIVGTFSLLGGGSPYPTIGASGGTFGILLAFGMLFPYRRVMLLFPPIPMEARYFVIIFGGLELFLGVSGLRTGIAHFAHLGGMLFGFLLILFWRGRLPIKPRERMYW